MEKQNFDVNYLLSKNYKTLDEYITLAEKCNINLSFEDLTEIKRVLEAAGNKCKENN